MADIRINLYSDTQTRPTQGMREFIAKAEVGDEQKKEDPTVNRLIEMVCDLLDKEDAIFLPSGTMCNQIAFHIHIRPGDEIIMDTTAHTRHFESGGPAALSGAMMYPLEGTRGVFSADQVQGAIRSSDHHAPRSRVLLVEQTSNMGGGSIWPLETIQDVCAVAASNGLARHMDGARLLNAVVATGIPAKEYAKHFDSLWIDFSKGLGAPVGAVLAGSRAFIQEAWRWKHQFGGAMRQAGIIAAGAVYALNNHIDRLAEDHANVQILARGLREIEGIQVEPAETNMLFFDVAALDLTAEAFSDVLAAHGIRVSFMGTRIRAVTHLDVSQTQIKEALDVIREVADEAKAKSG